MSVTLGKHFNIGGRVVYEDRVEVGRLMTEGGLTLDLAMVADGVGGQDKGERAAQIAVDAVLQYIRTSLDSDIPTLLTRAAQYANEQVYYERRVPGQEGMATTLTLAVVGEGNMLYVANVGDSRAYLVRNRNLTQLTMDHTVANLRGEGIDQPRGGALVRALGLTQDVTVDLGFYVDTRDPHVASERGRHGLALQPGDAVLVCSDGLIKNSRSTGEPLTKEREIVDVLTDEEGDRAARTLVAFALGRDPDDNVSAALLQIPDAARAGRRRRRRGVILAGGIVGMVVLLGLLAYVGSRLMQANGELVEVAAVATEAAGRATDFVEVEVLITITPLPPTTPTPRPSPVVGEIGALFGPSGRTPLIPEQIVTTGEEGALITVSHQPDAPGEDGRVYAFGPGTLALNSAADRGFALSLAEGGDVFVQTGRYGAAQVRLEPSGVVVAIEGDCLAVGPPEGASTGVVASCFAGTCRVTPEFGGDAIPVEAGTQAVIDPAARTVAPSNPIPDTAATRVYLALSEFSTSGEADAEQCVAAFLPSSAVSPTGDASAGAGTPAAVTTEP
jgi:serine/threonine protein phosphatase PrpC